MGMGVLKSDSKPPVDGLKRLEPQPVDRLGADQLADEVVWNAMRLVAPRLATMIAKDVFDRLYTTGFCTKLAAEITRRLD